MNRRGFMGALAASGLIPFLPKPDTVNVRLRYHKPVLLERTGGIKVSGGVWPSKEFYTGERAGITYTVNTLPDGSRLRVRLEGALARYHR